jgi:hypothetical protein
MEFLPATNTYLLIPPLTAVAQFMDVPLPDPGLLHRTRTFLLQTSTRLFGTTHLPATDNFTDHSFKLYVPGIMTFTNKYQQSEKRAPAQLKRAPANTCTGLGP